MPEGIGRAGEDADRKSTNVIPNIEAATIAGAAAGDLTVTGIKAGDKIQVVVDVSAADANLASEFEATAADTINNTGGTDTTGMVLLVIWTPAKTRF